MSPRHPSDIWTSLTHGHRQEIIDHVHGRIQTLTRPRFDLTLMELEDICRWALEGLGRSGPIEDAFGEGFEAGRQQGYEEGCAAAPTPQEVSGG